MKIAFCCIIKDDTELSKLKRCVESVEKYVDELHITANGDDVKGIEKYCQSKGIDYSYLRWSDDYSAQRNFNFNRVSDDVDYIFWTDSDDVLVGGEQLKDVALLAKKRELDVVFMSYWYGCNFNGDPSYKTLTDIEIYHQRERLIKPGRIEWKGRIHETPVNPEGQKDKYTNIVHTIDEPHKVYQIAVLHTGATKSTFQQNAQRTWRNRRLLELELKDERESGIVDPRTILYLMKIYALDEDERILNACIRLGEEYLSLSGWDEERATCYGLIADCFAKLGEARRAKTVLFGAIDEWPHDKILYLKLAEACFNLGQHKQMKRWMDVAKEMKIDKTTAGNRNLLEDKFLTNLLKMKYYFNVEKNVEKAYKAMEKICEIEPNKANMEQLEYLENSYKLNESCKNVDQLIRFLGNNIETRGYVSNILDDISPIYSRYPFYTRLKNSYTEPRIWGDNEICIVANFNGPHFEKWDPTSLEKGLGGSETAVVQLAKRFVKSGYKVTVYGDPILEGEYDGVIYLQWFKFNPKDNFNIFIQWRHHNWVDKISAKKILVDLHDVWHHSDYKEKITSIDKLMVKSKFHREMGLAYDDSKFSIISNGI